MDVYDFPFAFRSLTMNGHRSSAGLLIPANENKTIRVDRFDFSRVQYRDQRQPYNILTGADLGDAAPTLRYLSLAGMIVAPTGMELSDLISQVQQAFNVEEAISGSPATNGQWNLTFTDVTQIDTGRGTAYADPRHPGTTGFYLPERYLARPAGFPVITGRRSGGTQAGFAVELVCGDPRRYIQTAESVVLNSGNGYSASCPNWTATTGWATPFTATIVTSASGSATCTLDILGDGVDPLILNLSAVGAATVVWDSATGLITIAGAHRADLRASAAATLFARVPRGGGQASVTNATNITSVTLAYNQARG